LPIESDERILFKKFGSHLVQLKSPEGNSLQGFTRVFVSWWGTKNHYQLLRVEGLRGITQLLLIVFGSMVIR